MEVKIRSDEIGDECVNVYAYVPSACPFLSLVPSGLVPSSLRTLG